jgi:NADH-quinone oxidoreductase subunit G
VCPLLRRGDAHGELGIFHRGDHSEIGLFPGKALENKYSGNVIDICPVGALTDRDFRFKVRVWYLDTAKSVCNGCARGCNIEVHTNKHRHHHNEGRGWPAQAALQRRRQQVVGV